MKSVSIKKYITTPFNDIKGETVPILQNTQNKVYFLEKLEIMSSANL